MSREKRRETGLLAAWHASVIVANLPFTAKMMDPEELNPFRERKAKPKAMKELESWQAKRKWSVKHGSKRKRDE